MTNANFRCSLIADLNPLLLTHRTVPLSNNLCFLAYTYTKHLHILAEYLPILDIYAHPVDELHSGYAPHIHTVGECNMRTVSIFKNGNNRAICRPRDLDFEGVSEL